MLVEPSRLQAEVAAGMTNDASLSTFFFFLNLINTCIIDQVGHMAPLIHRLKQLGHQPAGAIHNED